MTIDTGASLPVYLPFVLMHNKPIKTNNNEYIHYYYIHISEIVLWIIFLGYTLHLYLKPKLIILKIGKH